MTKRILGFDLARCLAIFGMVVVNFRIAMGADSGGNVWLENLTGLLDGRAAATFVMLAGIGLSLMTRSALESDEPSALASIRRTLLKRSLFLFVIGLLFMPVWTADILHYYGVYIALAVCCLKWKSSRLLLLATILVLGFFVLVLLLDYERGWNWDTFEYHGFWQPAGFLRNLLFNGFHPVIPWLSFLLVGIVLGRMNLSDRSTRLRVFVSSALVAICAESLSRWAVGQSADGLAGEEAADLAAIFGTSPMPPMPLYMLAAGGTAAAIIALCVAVGDKFGEQAWIRPFVSTGQLALSIYVGHVFLGLGVLDAFGSMKNQTLQFSVWAALCFCVFAVFFSHVWRSKFKRGPLEILMRKMT